MLVAHKQSAWDGLVVGQEKASFQSGLQSPRDRASFLAAASPHSGEWLNALPLAACGLSLDDEAVRVAVALRLGLQVCAPHECKWSLS